MRMQRARDWGKRNGAIVIFMMALAALVFCGVLIFQQSRKNGALAAEVLEQGRQIKDQGAAIEQLAKVISAQSITNGQTGAAVLANQVEIKKAADAAAAASKSSAEVSTFLRNCFNPPNGECAKAAADAARRTQAQLDRVTATIQSFRFDVTGRVENGSFRGTAQPTSSPPAPPPPPMACIGVGNVDVLGGALSCKTP